MSESPTTSAKTPDVIQDPEPTQVEDRVSQAPVLVTEQKVMFSTAAAAVPLRPTTITRRLTDAIRVVGAALYRPPRAPALPGALHLPRPCAHGARNVQTLSTLLSAVTAVYITSWLDRWDHKRHLDD